ncbi:hypothetical protein Thimo_1644 [Thioflavicoccus mobilis 8321]|uniref:Uncharacterized protein n=1 Tax=Thioflavicoccus mobilis 8321 TaxID=765912 RepID=L0GX67_9GAMM|nr:hypothetical protein Thimo_1644 [Thioflavicoccus mobilis 8321]
MSWNEYWAAQGFTSRGYALGWNTVLLSGFIEKDTGPRDDCRSELPGCGAPTRVAGAGGEGLDGQA